MRWFVDLSTRDKLFVGFGLMFFLLVVVTATAYGGINMVLRSDEALRTNFTVAAELAEIRSNMSRSRAKLLEMMLLTDRREQEKRQQEIRETAAENNKRLETIIQKVGNDRDVLQQLREMQEVRKEYLRVQEKQFELILIGDVGTARLLGESEQDRRYDNLSQRALEVGRRMGRKAEQSADVARQRAVLAQQSFTVVAAVAAALALLMVLFLNRMIAEPLREVSEAAERIAVGDLAGVEISSDHRRDEVGVLTQTFSRMTRSLRAVAGVATQMAEGDLRVRVEPQSERDLLGNAFASLVANLQHITADTTEAVNVLSASTGQILASTTQLAASATQTAAAVSQTTATVEEIRQTAQVSSQKSRQVAESAQNSARIAQEGRRAAEGTAADMRRIRQQMEAIAGSMHRLSEQSQAIAEIIATVDDLAQQSNLLAVNAAIEAARAGEQGKGFAVVAQEVKSLADQSKQATTQVRGILSDIQKATEGAMQATEQGGKAVEAGVRQSAQAGESIQSLAERITEAAQAATQIAASTQQQLVGMDQVALAMDSVKQASVQNVDGARQLETAARGLADLGQRLKRQVERYQV